jgi:3-deoxy-D-manno-octulosonic-acid transferase
MNLLYVIYLCLSTVLIVSLLPFILICVFLTGRYKKLVFQRLGIYPKLFPPKKYRIWLHAVSVGEINVARSIIKILLNSYPDIDIVLSTTTPRGYDLASTMNNPRLQCVYSPIDFIVSVRLALHAIQPDILVMLETEIWPNWIYMTKALNIPVCIVNGRISQKSINGFQKFASLVRFILQKIDIFSMISPDNANRICQLGAQAQKVYVSGNAKFDLLEQTYRPRLPVQLKRLLSISTQHFVFVAGSTRTGEEEMVIDAYLALCKKVPGALCIIAPRHIERCPGIENMLEKTQLKYNRYSWCKETKSRNAPVILVDTIGDLVGLYSIANVVFCGGSLVPQGGQNVLEPAVWGKPVLYGPYMDDFLWAKDVLEEAAGGIMVIDVEELTNQILQFATHKDRAIKTGQQARTAVLKLAGAAQKHVDLIIQALLEEKISSE